MSENQTPIHVLRSNKGGHVYHVIAERKKRGGLIEWRVVKPDDEMFDCWMLKDRVLELAEPAWEWDERLYETLMKADDALAPLNDKCDEFALAYDSLGACLNVIKKLRNGEK